MRVSDPSSIILQPCKSGAGHKVNPGVYLIHGFESAQMAAQDGGVILGSCARRTVWAAFVGKGGGKEQSGQPCL